MIEKFGLYKIDDVIDLLVEDIEVCVFCFVEVVLDDLVKIVVDG